MSSWTYALTNKGRQLQAKAQTGIKLEYTRMAVGSGALAGQSLAAMTALITPVKNVPIVRLKHPEGSTRAVVGATLTNADVTTGFYLREIGIYATDPDDGEILYMYANAGSTADYIAPSGDGVIQKDVNVNVIVGTATNVTAVINESLVYVTRDEFEEALANIDVDVSDASLTEKGIVQLTNAIDSISEVLAPTAKAVKTAYDRGSAGVTAAATAQSRADAAFTEATAAKQLGVEQKNNVVAALNSIGVTASTSETWEQLIPKMAAVIRATGNATAAQVLSGATFSNATGNGLTGTLANRGAGGTVTPGTANQTKAAGYYSSAITILGDADLNPANIRKDVDIFGQIGTLDPSQAGIIFASVINAVGFSFPSGARYFVPIAQKPAGAKFMFVLPTTAANCYYWASANNDMSFTINLVDVNGMQFDAFVLNSMTTTRTNTGHKYLINAMDRTFRRFSEDSSPVVFNFPTGFDVDNVVTLNALFRGGGASTGAFVAQYNIMNG